MLFLLLVPRPTAGLFVQWLNKSNRHTAVTIAYVASFAPTCRTVSGSACLIHRLGLSTSTACMHVHADCFAFLKPC